MVGKGALGVSGFRVQWVRVEYACREANGSMRALGPGESRKERYCPDCTASQCLFTPSSFGGEEEQGKAKVKDEVKMGGNTGRRNRARGLNSRGEPLLESCWNCVHLRQVWGDSWGYVCRWEPGEKPMSRWTMEQSPSRRVENRECERFWLRLVVEIPWAEWEEG